MPFIHDTAQPASRTAPEPAANTEREPARESANERFSERKPIADNYLEQLADSGKSGAGEKIPHLQQLEGAFGQDLGDIKAHQGPESRQAADKLGASAYTHRESIVLGDRQDPQTVGEEVCHVLQQRKGSAGGASTMTDPSGMAEQEAAFFGQQPAFSPAGNGPQSALPQNAIARRRKSSDTMGPMADYQPLNKVGSVACGWLRVRRGPNRRSRSAGSLRRGSKLKVTAKVQSSDSRYPTWYRVEGQGKSGFAATNFVNVGDKAPKKRISTTQARQTDPKKDQGSGQSPWSGHLRTLWERGEFKQVTSKKKVLYLAIVDAMQRLASLSGKDEKKLTSTNKKSKKRRAMLRQIRQNGRRGAEKAASYFIKYTCTAFAEFLLKNMSDLQTMQQAVGPTGFGEFRGKLRGMLSSFYFDAFRTGSVRIDGYVLKGLGGSKGSKNLRGKSIRGKAKMLRRYSGEFVRIWRGAHYFIGEIRGDILYPYDNQRSKVRIGTVHLSPQRCNEKHSRRFLKGVKKIYPAKKKGLGGDATPKADIKPKEIRDINQPGVANVRGRFWLRRTPFKQTKNRISRYRGGKSMSVLSEVRSSDSYSPNWLRVEIDGKQGYVANSWVTIGQSQQQTQTTTSGGTQITPPDQADQKKQGPWSGHLKTLWKRGEFKQVTSKKKVLYLAISDAMQQLASLSGKDKRRLSSTNKKSKKRRAMLREIRQNGRRGAEKAASYFIKYTCTAFAEFLLKNMSDLQSLQQAVGPTGFGQFRGKLRNMLSSYYFDAFRSGSVRIDGYVLKGLGGSKGSKNLRKKSIQRKAAMIRSYSGEFLRIWRGRHYFIGEVKGEILYPYDNQRNKKRIGTVHLSRGRCNERHSKRFLKDVKKIYPASEKGLGG